MLPYFHLYHGNPSSITHCFGWKAGKACENARQSFAKLIDVVPSEIVFTGSGTEANNLAIKGIADQVKKGQGHFICSSIEHSSVLASFQRLEEEGHRVSYLEVNSDGRVKMDHLKEILNNETVLVSIMSANNETGTLQPIIELAKLVKSINPNCLFHSDMVQACGKVRALPSKIGIDLASFSAHKMYGPKGIGALWVKNDIKNFISPLIDGGKQEKGLRSGTLNVPGIVGFGKAAELSLTKINSGDNRVEKLKDSLLDNLRSELGDLEINGSVEHC